MHFLSPNQQCTRWIELNKEVLGIDGCCVLELLYDLLLICCTEKSWCWWCISWRSIFHCIGCFVKDYNDHISEISNKLVAIMDSMLEMNISKVWLSHIYVNISVMANFVTTLMSYKEIIYFFCKIYFSSWSFCVGLFRTYIILCITFLGGGYLVVFAVTYICVKIPWIRLEMVNRCNRIFRSLRPLKIRRF